MTPARWDALAVASALALGLALRSWHISYAFDGDELFSVMLASGSFADTIARSLADTPHPPLHNILLHFWMALAGTSEAAARSLSILFSGGLIFFTHRIMRRSADAWVSWGVALLAACSPLLIYYGQQARPYSLIALLSAANLFAFLKTLDAPMRRGPLAVWTLTGAALCLSHYIGVIFIGMQAIWAVLERKPRAWRYILCGGAAVTPLLLWAMAAMGAKALGNANPVPQVSWIGPPHPSDFVRFYSSIFGTRFFTGWLFVALAVLAIAYARAMYRKRCFPAQHRLFLLLGIGIPVLAFAVSVWGPQPVFVYRQMIGAALAMLIVTGLAAMELPRWTGRALLCGLVGWMALSVRMVQPDEVNPPWREAAQWINQHQGSGPLVADEPFCQRPLAFYRGGQPLRLWSGLGVAEKRGAFTFACRPVTCTAMARPLGRRATLVRTWQWNRYAGKTAYNQLLLYTVRMESEPRRTPQMVGTKR